MAAADEPIAAAPTQADVNALRWYHTLSLPGGVETPGEYDLRPIVDRLPWPDSLEGMRCLDVGSRDGFYAFEMERRGAREVVSLDLNDPELIDFPVARPETAAVQDELDVGNRAFETARAALGSSVERRFESVYNLDPGTVGTFDFAVIGTLLIHLRDPVEALQGIRRVLTGTLLMNEGILFGADMFRRRAIAELLMRYGPFWWAMNPAALVRVAEAAGFEIVDRGRPYLIPNGAESRLPSLREAIRAGDLLRRLVLYRGAPHIWILARPRPS
jgi:tRNA (mo5U34)-methyltransferase